MSEKILRTPINILEINSIKEVLPEYFASEYPTLVSFLEAYYEFMNQEDEFNEVVNDLKNIRDISTTDLRYLDNMLEEIGLGVSQDFFENPREIVKNFARYFRVKGSVYSLEGFFRAFFNTEAELSYPKDYIFTVGDPDSKLGVDGTKVLQNGKSLQVLSILLSTDVSLAKWGTAYKKYVHPAGVYLYHNMRIDNKKEVGIAPRISIPKEDLTLKTSSKITQGITPNPDPKPGKSPIGNYDDYLSADAGRVPFCDQYTWFDSNGVLYENTNNLLEIQLLTDSSDLPSRFLNVPYDNNEPKIALELWGGSYQEWIDRGYIDSADSDYNKMTNWPSWMFNIAPTDLTITPEIWENPHYSCELQMPNAYHHPHAQIGNLATLAPSWPYDNRCEVTNTFSLNPAWDSMDSNALALGFETFAELPNLRRIDIVPETLSMVGYVSGYDNPRPGPLRLLTFEEDKIINERDSYWTEDDFLMSSIKMYSTLPYDQYNAYDYPRTNVWPVAKIPGSGIMSINHGGDTIGYGGSYKYVLPSSAYTGNTSSPYTWNITKSDHYRFMPTNKTLPIEASPRASDHWIATFGTPQRSSTESISQIPYFSDNIGSTSQTFTIDLPEHWLDETDHDVYITRHYASVSERSGQTNSNYYQITINNNNDSDEVYTKTVEGLAGVTYTTGTIQQWLELDCDWAPKLIKLNGNRTVTFDIDIEDGIGHTRFGTISNDVRSYRTSQGRFGFVFVRVRKNDRMIWDWVKYDDVQYHPYTFSDLKHNHSIKDLGLDSMQHLSIYELTQVY